MMIHEGYAQQVVVDETVRRILDLRETLVRFDENLAAWHLLSKCVPYFAADHPAIVEARRDQYLMTRHVLPDEDLAPEDRNSHPYESYYATNPHELIFERQYGLPIEQVHQLPRVQFLLDGLKDQCEAAGVTTDALRILDVGCNDGFVCARLAIAGYTADGVDLHPGNIEIARERKATYPAMGEFKVGDATRDDGESAHDAVVAYELIEHVRDPAELLDAMVRAVKPGGALYVSTPHGAVEGGNLPTWWQIEPKGHVRSFTPQAFRATLERVGTIDRLEFGPDGVMAARIRPT